MRAVRDADLGAVQLVWTAPLRRLPQGAPVLREDAMNCAYSPSQKHEWNRETRRCVWCGDEKPMKFLAHSGATVDVPAGLRLGMHIIDSDCKGKVQTTAEGDARCLGCGRRFRVAAVLRYEEA